MLDLEALTYITIRFIFGLRFVYIFEIFLPASVKICRMSDHHWRNESARIL